MDYRRPTRENATPQPNVQDAHTWWCWETQDGPGSRLREELRREVVMMKQDAAVVTTEIRKELTTLNKRSWYQAGGGAAVGLIAMAFLAAWLSSKFAATESRAVKHADVESAIQRSAAMAVAKQGDDFMEWKRKIEQAAVDVSKAAPPPPARARK